MNTVPVAFEDLQSGDIVKAYVRFYTERDFVHIYEGPAYGNSYSDALLFANGVLRDGAGDRTPHMKFISATREIKVPTEEHILVHQVSSRGHKDVPEYAMKDQHGNYLSSEDYYKADDIVSWEPITRGEVQVR